MSSPAGAHIAHKVALLRRRPSLTWADVFAFLRSPAVLGAITGAVMTALLFTAFFVVWWLCRRVRRRNQRRAVEQVLRSYCRN
jgi:uncharacterized protein (DUF2062 family)